MLSINSRTELDIIGLSWHKRTLRSRIRFTSRCEALSEIARSLGVKSDCRDSLPLVIDDPQQFARFTISRREKSVI